MLALISGEGALPKLLYAHLAKSGNPPLIVEMDGFPSGIPDAEPITFHVEHLGTMLGDLRDRGVTQLCLAGRVRRPKLDPAMVDAATEPFVPAIAHAIQAGDDAALREILAIIEEFGFTLLAAHEVLPDLLLKPGIAGAHQPNDQDRKDAIRAAVVVDAIGRADIGQACVVAQGQVIATEAFGGTDWMLASVSGANRPAGPVGGILFKAAKPGQDRRADLPVIGPTSIPAVVAAGLNGIAIQSGGVMVMDADATIKAADKAGIFLWVREDA